MVMSVSQLPFTGAVCFITKAKNRDTERETTPMWARKLTLLITSTVII